MSFPVLPGSVPHSLPSSPSMYSVSFSALSPLSPLSLSVSSPAPSWPLGPAGARLVVAQLYNVRHRLDVYDLRLAGRAPPLGLRTLRQLLPHFGKHLVQPRLQHRLYTEGRPVSRACSITCTQREDRSGNTSSSRACSIACTQREDRSAAPAASPVH